MSELVDGNKVAAEILSDLRSRVADLGYKPRLIVILLGENPASLSYIKMKQKRGEEIGIDVEIHKYSLETSQEQLLSEIRQFNKQKNVRGILIQLPLPKFLDRDTVLNAVDPKLDVDCLTNVNKQALIRGEDVFVPPAAAAVMKILEYYAIKLNDKNILLVGSGDLIGKPLAAILLNMKIPFELANSYTENLKQLVMKADIIVTGVGKAGLITGELIKDGAMVIDAGTTGSDECEIIGDVDTKSVAARASLLAAVPGGVGPVTVAMLLQNVVSSAQSP